MAWGVWLVLLAGVDASPVEVDVWQIEVNEVLAADGSVRSRQILLWDRQPDPTSGGWRLVDRGWYSGRKRHLDPRPDGAGTWVYTIEYAGRLYWVRGSELLLSQTPFDLESAVRALPDVQYNPLIP